MKHIQRFQFLIPYMDQGQQSTFSEYSHVLYQIKRNDECSPLVYLFIHRHSGTTLIYFYGGDGVLEVRRVNCMNFLKLNLFVF